jgi:hypothetical protein
MNRKPKRSDRETRAARPPGAAQRRESEHDERQRQPGMESVAITVRLPTDVAHGLRHAIADRLVTRVEPRKQQDIVAAALAAWLAAEGYTETGAGDDHTGGSNRRRSRRQGWARASHSGKTGGTRR